MQPFKTKTANNGGLAVGVAACLVILLFIIDELSYDRFNEKAERIYHVNSEVKFGGNDFNMAVSPAPAGSALIQDYPEVEAFVRFKSFGAYLVKAEIAFVELIQMQAPPNK